jgi:membrane fusion protein (multidrug efflux system)
MSFTSHPLSKNVSKLLNKSINVNPKRMNDSNKQRLRTLVLSIAGYTLLAGFIAACTSKADDLKGETKTAAVVPSGVPVDAVIVQPGIVRDELEVTGTIVANQQVDIASELTRKVVRVNVKEGSKVKRGTLLFQLDDADLQAQLERFRQQEKLAKLNEVRLKDLIEKEAIAQQDYDEASTNLKVLQAQILEVQVMIDKTRIVAPFDGQIGMINTYPGAIVSVNTILTNIEDNSVVKVEFSVPEKYTNIIQTGSEQTFTVISDSKQYKTKVVARGASLSNDTRTLLVRGATSNPEGKLLPGQSVRLTLSLNTSSSALTVASQALIPSSNGYSVFVSRKNKAEAIPVVIGQRSTGSVEITKGLSQGDTVIVSNLLRLGPGAPVQLVSVK